MPEKYRIEVYSPGAGSVKPVDEGITDCTPPELLALVFHWSSLGYAVKLFEAPAESVAGTALDSPIKTEVPAV